MHAVTAALVATAAEEQHGVVSRQQLLRLGLDPGLAAREVRAGRWCRLTPGTYLTSPGPPTFLALCHAARLHGGARAAISGEAGAFLRTGRTGLGDAPPGRVLVVVPHALERVSTELVDVRRTRATGPDSRVTAQERPDGLRVAELSRCLADEVLVATTLQDARATLMALLRQHRVPLDEVAAWWPSGSELAERAAFDYRRGARSAPEAEAADDLVLAARRGLLPPFLLNPLVYLGDELLGSPDEWFVGLGLGGEMDSRKHHGEAEDLDATLRRHDRFGQARLELRHTTPRRYRADRRGFVRDMIQAVAARRALPVPEPPGLRVVAQGPLLPEGVAWPLAA